MRARLLTRVINVLDANDVLPEFLGLDSNGRYRGTVAENAAAGATVLQVSAQDKDSTAAYSTVSVNVEAISLKTFRLFILSPKLFQHSYIKSYFCLFQRLFSLFTNCPIMC